MSSQRPPFQRFVEYSQYIFLGVLGLGALLDAISNAVELIGIRSASLSTVLICIFWLGVELWARKYGIEWRTSGQTNIVIRHLGIAPRLFFVGCLTLVWLSLIVSASLGGTYDSNAGREADPRTEQIYAGSVLWNHRPKHRIVDSSVSSRIGLPRDFLADSDDVSSDDQQTSTKPTALPFVQLLSSDFTCAEIYESNVAGSYTTFPTANRAGFCNPPELTLVSDYYGVWGGTFFLAFMRGVYYDVLARNSMLIPAGTNLYLVGCETQRDEAIRLRAKLLNPNTIRCDRGKSFDIDFNKLPNILTDSDYEEEWSDIIVSAQLHVEARAEIWPQGHALRVRLNEHELVWSEGRAFPSVCSDFPSYVVSAQLTDPPKPAKRLEDWSKEPFHWVPDSEPGDANTWLVDMKILNREEHMLDQLRLIIRSCRVSGTLDTSRTNR